MKKERAERAPLTDADKLKLFDTVQLDNQRLKAKNRNLRNENRNLVNANARLKVQVINVSERVQKALQLF